MLAVKQQKPEVQQFILMITTLKSDNNDGNNNLCIKGMFWVLIMINVQMVVKDEDEKIIYINCLII